MNNNPISPNVAASMRQLIVWAERFLTVQENLSGIPGISSENVAYLSKAIRSDIQDAEAVLAQGSVN
ncbi:hypothetical protein [uncultured Roseibium sp.]|uniref:hypothetical protein n=1 Tax=uncultured Roseibium sp. TaxID=1936171 RepID=UPI0026301A77|nr:hypothetical protein [uncultured Roseibium sp.]